MNELGGMSERENFKKLSSREYLNENLTNYTQIFYEISESMLYGIELSDYSISVSSRNN